MAEFHVTATVQKATDTNGVIHLYGWAAMSRDDLGEPVIDADGEYIPIDGLEKAAQDAFLRRGGKGAVGVQHESFARADLVESFVLSADKRAAFGLGDGPLGWMVGLRSEDPEVAKAVRSGALLELSIRGFGRTESVSFPRGQAADYLKRDADPVAGIVAGRSQTETVGVIRDLSLADVELLSIVDRGASANKRVRSRLVLVKRKQTEALPMQPKTKRNAQMILAELFEQGKLAELAPEDKETLLTSLAMPAAPSAPESKPEPEPEPKADDKEPEAKAEPEAEPEEKTDDGEPMSKRETDLAKQNVELAKRVADLERVAKRADVVEMVKRDLAYFPGASVDEMADVIQDARENLGTEKADRLVEMMRSASEVAKGADLFKAAGVRKGGGSADDSPDAALLAIAKAKQEADPKMSRHEAIIAAGRERPDLWAKRSGR